MRRLMTTSVAALTLTVTGMTQAAEEPAVAPVQAAPAPEPVRPVSPAPPERATELAMRPKRSLPLAEEHTSSSWPAKLLFVAVAGAAGVFAWRKRKQQKPALRAKTELRIASRATVGIRSEVALVEIGGMRVLVGVTPSSMQTLAILPDDGAEAIPSNEIDERPSRADSRVDSRADAGTNSGVLNRDGAERVELGAGSLLRSLEELEARAALPSKRDSVAPPRESMAAPKREVTRENVSPSRRDASTTDEPRPARERRGSRETSRSSRDVEGQARGLVLALGARR